MFYDPADIHAAALRGKAIAAWNRWGHNRPVHGWQSFLSPPCPSRLIMCLGILQPRPKR